MADKKPEKKETSTEAVKKVDKKLPFFKRIGKWFRDMKSELKKVTWPTSKQVVRDTLTVIVIVVISALFIGVIDLVFKNIVSFSVGNGLSSLF